MPKPCLLFVPLLTGLVTLACIPEERKGKPAAASASAPAASALALPANAIPSGVTSATPAHNAVVELRELAAAPQLAELLTTKFTADFEREDWALDWNLSGSGWRIAQGRLCGQGAHNHPAWLRRRLPTNARVEFDAKSFSEAGDIKAEVWGDGQRSASGTSYTDASSYVLILGGWSNQFHVLARQDEHAKDRLELKVQANTADFRHFRVAREQNYHIKIERTDHKTVRVWVDDIELFSFADTNPLTGAGHEYFGFNNWETLVCFDNLIITPLKS